MTDNGRLPTLKAHATRGARVEARPPEGWRLSLPPGPRGAYRCAQLDDPTAGARSAFRWRPPLTLTLSARVWPAQVPGTWGFGFWNDPFSAGLGIGGSARRLPVLPDAAWFFFAAPPNHLSFGGDHPAQGLLAATFASCRLPGLLLAPGALAAPLLAWPPTARLLRRVLHRLIAEDSTRLTLDATAWHTYRLDWSAERVEFWVDGAQVFTTPVAPRGPLTFVLWIDNQFAAFPPDGRVRSGLLAGEEPCTLEVQGSEVVAG